MIKKIYSRSAYARNVIFLITGTILAQAIPIAISPILTRLYTPHEFGLYALYMAIVSMCSTIATGRYELAIMLPKKDEDALQITALTALITTNTSIVILIIVILFDYEIAKILENLEIIPWLYLLPVSVLVTGLYQTLNYWNSRKNRYTSIATNRVVQSGGTVSYQLLLGIWFQSIGLIFGQLLGQLTSLMHFMKIYLKNDGRKKPNSIKMQAMARRYSNFPKIDVPTAFINISANQAPNILLASLFTTNTAGFYYLTQRVLQAPITVISASVLDVFKQRAASDYKKYGHCRDIYKKTFWSLLILALPPSLILHFWIVDIFVFVFGEPWREAGIYAQILIPALSIRLIANPLSFVIYITEKQILNLIGMITLFFLMVSSIYFAKNINEAVHYISLSNILIYVMYLLVSAKLAKAI